jgi:energy-converting hydrogenase Eha subunit G
MGYPRWFLFPKAWLNALILTVSLSLLKILFRVVGESSFNLLEVAWHDPFEEFK